MWHPSSTDAPVLTAPKRGGTGGGDSPAAGGWGEFDPRTAPPIFALAPTETRTHHDIIMPDGAVADHEARDDAPGSPEVVNAPAGYGPGREEEEESDDEEPVE
eukprot:COSAG06_NODE_8989_length_2017_cov_1476.919708_3_plen_103_part_00